MAVRAVEANYSTSGLEVRDLDPSPTSLDLPAIQEAAVCPYHHRVCVGCGSPLCDDCDSHGLPGMNS